MQSLICSSSSTRSRHSGGAFSARNSSISCCSLVFSARNAFSPFFVGLERAGSERLSSPLHSAFDYVMPAFLINLFAARPAAAISPSCAEPSMPSTFASLSWSNLVAVVRVFEPHCHFFSC